MKKLIFNAPKTLRDIKSLPFVSKVSHEGEDGFWLYLKTGYISVKMDCGTIHEHTIKECIDALNEGIYKL